MRVLVTGVTGFVGRHLVETLRPRHELVGLARRPAVAGEANGVNWVIQDLTRPLDRKRLPTRVDAVIHLAQARRFREFPDEAEDIFGVNVRGTLELLEYARGAGAETFVYASTGGVYARRRRPLTELDPAIPLASVRPLGFYLASKYAAELLMEAYRPLLRTVAVRLFFVYGVGQQAMLVPRLFDSVDLHRPITIEGRPGLRINPIHVSDAVRAFEATLTRGPPGIVNVAGDEHVSIRGLVRLMEQISGKRATVRYTRSLYTGDLVGANDRMKAELGVRPTVTLRDGLASVYAAR
jgi:UDP-glucose 4-epimerase